MTELDDALEAYRASLHCQEIAASFLTKTRKSRLFHNTIFLNQALEDARTLLARAETQLRDLTIVALVSAFECILFEDPRSPLRSKTHRQQTAGLHDAIIHFRKTVAASVYEDVERLCRYRDWVAHGKRWRQPAMADPVNTYDRLRDFLRQVGLQHHG